MKQNVSVLLRVVPKYGELLLGIGNVVNANSQTLYEDTEAREAIKKYLLEEAPKMKNIKRVSNSLSFQDIMYEYTGRCFGIKIKTDKEDKNDERVNVYLVDFFAKAIWPILVRKYIDNIDIEADAVCIKVNIKKNVFFAVYGVDDSELFFEEFKKFLLYNYIVISEAEMQENGDMLVKLMVPIPPHIKYDFTNL